MARVNKPRTIAFSLVDTDSTPITGRLRADLVIVFTRNTLSCSDTLAFTNLGSGRYQLAYTPTVSGQDYLSVYDAASDLLWADTEHIDSDTDAFGPVAIQSVDHNYPTTNSLLVRLPYPERFKIYAFLSQSWQEGRQRPVDAVAATTVQPNGTWTNSLGLTKGNYHIVAVSPYSQTIQTLATYLPIAGL